MFIGLPNPNFALPVTKLCITNKVTNEKIYALYNPQSYVQERSAKYSETPGLASNAPSIQFVHGTSETLEMELFFDSFDSGAEVGGTVADRARFEANGYVPSMEKMDVRKYTSKIYDLMLINPSTHVPPLVKVEWSSLQFTGHLVSCSQKFTKFSEKGKPVRATLNVSFKQYLKPTEIAKLRPNESPDTAKYRTVRQGDALWSLAAREYGQCGLWREIAVANGIENPRLLDTGGLIRLPALD